MTSTIHSAVRATFCAGLILTMCLSAMSLSPKSVAAQENIRSINEHNVSGRFLQVWSSHGSDQANVYVNGLPLTDQRPEISMTDGKTYDVQWFERARYESHPENSAPFDVLLGLLGLAVHPADPPAAPLAGAQYFKATGHNLGGGFREFWATHGGLPIFGSPISEERGAVFAGQTETVQYFDRARFAYHPERAGRPAGRPIRMLWR